MDVDNIMLVSFRTLCFIGIIYASITLYNADWLFVDIPAGEDVFVDFECSSLLENDLTTDWYYQQCLSDKDGTQQTMYDHIVLLFRANTGSVCSVRMCVGRNDSIFDTFN